MKPKNSENTDWTPEKTREYRLYRIWKNLPSDKTILQDTNNPELQELLDIRTQEDFANKYGLHRDTLTDWNQKPIPPEYQDISWRYWLKDLGAEINKLLMEGMKKRKDPATAKLLHELAGEYVEKREVKVDVGDQAFETIKSIAERNNGAT